MITRVVIVAISLGSVPLLQSAGETPHPGGAQAWFEDAWEAAQRLPDFRDFSLRWIVEDLSVPNPGRVAEMRRNVQQFPEHPDRLLLPAIEQRLGGEADKSEVEVWCRGPGRWRYNRTILRNVLDQKPEYWDCAMNQDYAWSLVPGQAIIINTNLPPPQGHDFALVEASLLPD